MASYCKPERGPLLEPDHIGTLILDFQLPEQLENKFRLLKLSSLVLYDDTLR
jgi:hypothetical protein